VIILRYISVPVSRRRRPPRPRSRWTDTCAFARGRAALSLWSGEAVRRRRRL